MTIRDQRLLAEYAEDVFSCELCDLLHCCRRGNGEVHHITGGDFRTVLSAGLASGLQVLIKFLDPKNTAFGIKEKSAEDKAAAEKQFDI